MSFQCKVAGAQDSSRRREICIKDVRCPHDIAITSKIDSRNGTLPLQYISYLSNVPLAIEHHHEHHSSELRPAESPFAYQPHRSPKGKHLIGQLSAASSRGIHGKNLLGSAKKCTPDSSKRYVWAFVPGAERSRAEQSGAVWMEIAEAQCAARGARKFCFRKCAHRSLICSRPRMLGIPCSLAFLSWFLGYAFSPFDDDWTSSPASTTARGVRSHLFAVDTDLPPLRRGCRFRSLYDPGNATRQPPSSVPQSSASPSSQFPTPGGHR